MHILSKVRINTNSLYSLSEGFIIHSYMKSDKSDVTSH